MVLYKQINDFLYDHEIRNVRWLIYNVGSALYRGSGKGEIDETWAVGPKTWGIRSSHPLGYYLKPHLLFS